MKDIETLRKELSDKDPGPFAEKAAALYLGKVLQELNVRIEDLDKAVSSSAKKIIESNEKVASSNERHSKKMAWLTFGLVVFSAAQVIVTLISNA